MPSDKEEKFIKYTCFFARLTLILSCSRRMKLGYGSEKLNIIVAFSLALH